MTLPKADDVKTIIASPCLVRPDRAGRSLFISDFARRLGVQAPQAAHRLAKAGFVLTPLAGGMSLVSCPARTECAHGARQVSRIMAHADAPPGTH